MWYKLSNNENFPINSKQEFVQSKARSFDPFQATHTSIPPLYFYPYNSSHILAVNNTCNHPLKPMNISAFYSLT